MADNAISRVARAMDIIPYVSENPGTKISVLASKFGVTEKQIVKDLELIFLCGLPGYTPYELIDLTFEDGLVTVIDPQLFDKPRKFTETEGVIIILGLILLKRSINDSEKTQNIDDLIEKLTERYKVSNNAAISDIEKPHFYTDILNSINKNIDLIIEYNSISEDRLTRRVIKPLRISIKNGFYYLYAVDLEVDAERIYRIDQIRSVAENQSKKILQINKDSDSDDLVFELKVRNQLITEKYREIFLEIISSGNHFVVKGRSNNKQWLYRWILSNCSEIEVTEPKTLKDLIRSRAQSTLALYHI